MPIKFIFSLFLSSAIALAGTTAQVDFKGTTTTLDAGDTKVPVYSQATLTVGSTATPLTLTGAGIRSKVEFVFPINLYGISSYIDTDLSTIDPGTGRDAVLKTVSQAKNKVLQLTLTFGLTADQITTAFTDALNLNGVTTTGGPVKSLLDQIKRDTVVGDVITIAGYPANDKEDIVSVDMLLHTDASGNALASPQHVILTAQGANLSSDFWKVWFASPDDDLLKTLQDNLINQIIKP
jgi:hypothetical protein